jgi:cyclophilin family peptidyl-prolyl cis-trans isomerase
MKKTVLMITVLISFVAFGKNPIVKLETTHGTIEIELFEKKAPITVKNFLNYVKSGFYNGTIFHRVIDNFMIQGGGFDKNFKEKTTKAPIKNEATNGLANEPWTVAMARTSVVNSATAQFFININNNTYLNHTSNSPQGFGYAVFGKVIKGMSVVNRIKKVKTTKKGRMSNVPSSIIEIKKITKI